MTAVKLDVKDRRILAALDSNSRQPLSAIAKRTGLSEQVVSYRISRLVERGVITGFVAFISPAKLGYMTFKLFIKLGNIRPGVESELIGYLVRSRSTMWVFSCTGRYDLVVLVSARDPEHFRSFWNNFQSKYGKYVTGVDTAVNIYVYEYMRKYLGAGGEILANTSYLGGPIRREDIDELDLRILKEVSCDSRASNMAIGKKVGASAEVVRYRIKELVAKGVIPAFRIWVNTERLGMQFYKVLLHIGHMSGEQEERLRRFCETHPYITAFLTCFGSWNAELEMDVKDSVHLQQIMREMGSEFGSIIHDYEPLLLYKCNKSSYMPG